VHPRSESPPAAPPETPAADEPSAAARQRWRLVLARSVAAPGVGSRDLIDVWESALAASTLPLYRPPGRTRARIAFAAPILPALEVERELADIVLTEFVPIWRVREGLADRLPDGWRIVGLYDVWLAGPPLAGQVVAADYRIAVAGADPETLRDAAAGLLRADRLPRERPKGDSTVRYDLRPLLADVSVAGSDGPATVRARTRFDPVLGTGRPEEVVAALGEAVGAPLTITSLVRERLVLADDQD
jgi:Uncharacterized protein conserved in bacteria (DUF2344)